MNESHNYFDSKLRQKNEMLSFKNQNAEEKGEDSKVDDQGWQVDQPSGDEQDLRKVRGELT